MIARWVFVLIHEAVFSKPKYGDARFVSPGWDKARWLYTESNTTLLPSGCDLIPQQKGLIDPKQFTS